MIEVFVLDFSKSVGGSQRHWEKLLSLDDVSPKGDVKKQEKYLTFTPSPANIIDEQQLTRYINILQEK